MKENKMTRLITFLIRIFGLKKTYKWRLNEDYEYVHSSFNGIEESNPYVSVSDGRIIIHKGYAWNGCSPNLEFLSLITLGTPDGTVYYKTGKQKAYYASLVHDAIYQYEIIDKNKADEIFRSLLKESEFMLANPYYFAVRLFGKRW